MIYSLASLHLFYNLYILTGMVEKGLEMSDIVNHGIVTTESMEPLLAQVQYRT